MEEVEVDRAVVAKVFDSSTWSYFPRSELTMEEYELWFSELRELTLW